MNLQAVIAQLSALGCEPKETGDGYEAYCPAHELDGQRHKKSLSIKQGHSVPVICYCHAGCSYHDLLKVIPEMQVKGRQLEAEYRYRSATGKIEFVKVRYYPKEFSIRNPNINDKRDKRAYKLPSVKDIGEYPLYNLPDVLAAKDTGETVYCVEGEKDADRLVKHGLVATTNYEGAGKWKANYDLQLAGLKSLVLIPDNDEPGRAHMATIADRLQGKVGEILVLDLGKRYPDLRSKGDLSDWLNTGHSIEELVELVSKASPESPASDAAPKGNESGQPGKTRTNQDTPRKSLFVDAATLVTNPRPPDWLIRNWIVRDSLTTVFGDPGGGKSLLALDWACCVATGRNWNGCRVKPGAVLYIAGEGYAGIARRLAAWQLENEPLPPGRLFISERPVLLNAAGAAVVLEEVTALSEPPALVEVDTLARSIDGNENDAGDMGAFIRAVDTIRVNTRCALVVVHHCGAADKNRARGHTSLKGAVDAEVCVEKAGQPGQTGMSGVVRCTKAKDTEPPAPLAFEVHGVTLPKDWWDADEPNNPVTGATLHVTGELSMDPVRSKLPATSVIALAALRDALIQHGAEMAGVVAVTLGQWRDAAYGRGISDSELPDTRRKAFERARKDLLVRGAVVCAEELYWIPAPRTDRTNRT